MRGILKTKTDACGPHNWRIYVDLDVSFQYSKANSYKNTRIVCMGSHAYPSQCPSRHLRLVRFADEGPTEGISKPNSASNNRSAECKESESFAQGPKLACRFSKESKRSESSIAVHLTADITEPMPKKQGSSSLEDSFLTSATVVLSQWNEAISSKELFSLLTPSRLNSHGQD